MAIRRELIFSKTLTSRDINVRLAIPTKCLNHFGQITEGHRTAGHRTKYFEALDIEGNSWLFCLLTRTEGYSKPVLYGIGWRAFVRAKSLEEGDIITFFKEINEDNGMTFRIEAQKRIRLFGNDYTAIV